MENKKEFLIAIGRKIREYRDEKGLTLEDLAIRCNNHKTQIARIEQGKSNCGILGLQKICEAIGIPLSELFIEEREESRFN